MTSPRVPTTMRLVGVGLALVLGCVSRGDTPPCPTPFVERPELDAKLIEQLEPNPSARAAERETRRTRRLCHGPIEGGALTPDGAILLPADAAPATAARLAHLLVHLHDGFGQLAATDPTRCLEQAFADETSAWMVEFELRERLEVEPMSSFETTLRSVAPGSWAVRVRTWLERGEAPTWTAAHYEARCGIRPSGPTAQTKPGDQQDQR